MYHSKYNRILTSTGCRAYVSLFFTPLKAKQKIPHTYLIRLRYGLLRSFAPNEIVERNVKMISDPDKQRKIRIIHMMRVS